MDFAEKQAQEDRQHVWGARAQVVLPEHVLATWNTLWSCSLQSTEDEVGFCFKDDVPVSKSDPILPFLLSVLLPQQSHCWIHHATGEVIRESLYRLAGLIIMCVCVCLGKIPV